MKIEFLGQGFETVSDGAVGKNIIELLNNNSYHTFTFITAFTSLSAIKGIKNILKELNFNHLSKTIITGIDQKGTSKEALETLLKTDVKSYIFYQPSSSIFHPKIYLFEGDEFSTLIIGSSNLTSYGIFVNIEASLKITVSNTETEFSVISDLKQYFKGLFELTDPNLEEITQVLIDNLLSSGILPTESEKNKIYAKSDYEKVPESFSIGERMHVPFPKRARPKVPASFIGKPTNSLGDSNKQKPSAGAVGADNIGVPQGKLIWYTSSLPASSVQHKLTPNSKPTGGLRLVQAKFFNDGVIIDQSTYFRNIFGSYQWSKIKTTPYVEMATIPFELTILGINHGIHNLEVRHKPSGTAGQGNYTTSISWGSATSLIKRQNLTGRSLSLYSPTISLRAFSIVIE